MLVCAFLHNFARETAGAARTRLSLRPLFDEGERQTQTPGETRRGIAKVWLLLLLFAEILAVAV